jgi:hypothetical protein
MGAADCSVEELKERVAVLEVGIQAFREVLLERDIRYTQRAVSQDNAVITALNTSKEAATKAEIAIDKRLTVLNELRQVVLDQAQEFSRKAEVDLKLEGLEKRIDALASLVSAKEAHGVGVKEAVGYVVGVIGAVIAGLTLYFHK